MPINQRDRDNKLQDPQRELAGFAAKMMHTLHNLMLLSLLTILQHNAQGSEIVKGAKVPDNSMLYMASVQYKGKHSCGGFLVSEDFVLTAAHCNKDSMTVVLGTHNLKKVNDGTMRYNITRCIHKDYKGVKYGNDIMLLKLSKKVKLNRRVQPIRLPGAQITVKDKEKCNVAGWGKTKTGGNISEVLEAADVSVVNMNECRRKWEVNGLELPNNIICAGGYGSKKGFCQGDSGGPLVYNKMAVGIVSFNLKGDCNYPNVPNVYTDISKYMPWIQKILKQKRC